MLDTVILNIERGNYTVMKPEMFSPSAINLGSQATFYAKFVNNPNAEDRAKGNYKPRLTIHKRGWEAPLRIEFSPAKLLFNNNLQELSEKDFGKVIEILKTKLWDMGIGASEITLRSAAVSGFHPSKNIPITGGYSAMAVIAELEKINLTEKLDLNKTNFRNSGHSLQYYAKSHSLVFYDKIFDLKKSEKRAIDKDQKLQQRSLFEFIQQKKKPEILRMEVRLSEKQKMSSVLTLLGYGKNPKFENIFKPDICKKILIHYFNTYLLPSLFVFDFDTSPKSNLKKILHSYPLLKPAKTIYLTGLLLLCKDKGVRDLRATIQPRTSLRTWQRMADDIKLLNKMASVAGSHSFIKDIQQSLEKFEPYTPQ